MLLDYFWQEQDEGCVFILAPFAAFDTTDHIILLDQLRGIGGRWHCIVLFCLPYPGLVPVGDYWEGEIPPPAPTMWGVPGFGAPIQYEVFKCDHPSPWGEASPVC